MLVRCQEHTQECSEEQQDKLKLHRTLETADFHRWKLGLTEFRAELGHQKCSRSISWGGANRPQNLLCTQQVIRATKALLAVWLLIQPVQVSVVSSLLNESSSKDTRLLLATMAFVLQNHVVSGFICEVNYGSGCTRRLFINTE